MFDRQTIIVVGQKRQDRNLTVGVGHVAGDAGAMSSPSAAGSGLEVSYCEISHLDFQSFTAQHDGV